MTSTPTADVTDPASTIAAKRAFLATGAAWPGEPPPTCIETHASFVFLTRDRAWKIKKPIRLPHADMRSISARRHLCEEEFRLNRELAGAVYRRIVPLTLLPSGAFALDGQGKIIDWLIEMDRLPASAMLDWRIVHGPPPDAAEIAAVGARLTAFYSGRPPSRAHGYAYHDRLVRELATDIAHLREMAVWIGPSPVEDLCAHVPAWLDMAQSEIAERAASGLVIEGHGDLRAEHVCLVTPPVLFDRVEFNHDFRLIDPHDEIGALGLDCLRLGAGWIGPALQSQLSKAGIALPSPRLLALYRVLRCLTQARLSIDHFRDPRPRTPEKWAPRTRWFIQTAVKDLGH